MRIWPVFLILGVFYLAYAVVTHGLLLERGF